MILKIVFGFFRGIGLLRWPWWIWIGALMVVNGVMPLFFLGTREALWVLVAFFVAGGMQMALFGMLGFVRFLGLGHIIPWMPLVIWLWGRLAVVGTDLPFGKWILAVIILDGISLIIDWVDVFRYLAGDRTPALTVDDV